MKEIMALCDQVRETTLRYDSSFSYFLASSMRGNTPTNDKKQRMEKLRQPSIRCFLSFVGRISLVAALPCQVLSWLMLHCYVHI